MRSIGASKVSLSSFSSEELWQRSGRLDKGRTSELFQLEDRKGAKLLLSPTHEEEITTIIADAVHSYKDLPLRLYQVSRKYRDEPRPRQGLLRGREFLMKDLYTFDANADQAHETYDEVRRAYHAMLDELRMPYLTARADSGNMGGTLSHEFHFASPHGEDTIIKCNKCDYSINEELFIEEYDARSAPLLWESEKQKGE
jgi:prolyl-tRNA synthetase